ncbi:MAG: helix-turn-helix transcriptional regulator [Actinobacteria bacterium]|nr:helix-turn-helix transcriptional regulator [Actinomycetota bacterium]
MPAAAATAVPAAFESPERIAQLRVLRALGDPMRLEIIAQMAVRDETPCTLLEDLLPVSKSTISYHVKNLYVADLVTIRKEGRFYFYRLREDVLEEVLPGFLQRLVTA